MSTDQYLVEAHDGTIYETKATDRTLSETVRDLVACQYIDVAKIWRVNFADGFIVDATEDVAEKVYDAACRRFGGEPFPRELGEFCNEHVPAYADREDAEVW